MNLILVSKFSFKFNLDCYTEGVVTYADAQLAVSYGADAVWVSNHGGRQLDGACSTLAALPEVVAGVAGRLPVLFDGVGRCTS